MRVHLSVGSRCFIMFLVPAVLLSVLSLWLMWERWQTADRMTDLGVLAHAAPTVSGLVHEMQKERGYSAGFIGSGGQQFSEQLKNQRIVTDGARSSYVETLKTIDSSRYGQEFPALLRTISGAIDQLQDQRAEVSQLALPVADMAAYYTGTINKLLSLVDHIGTQSNEDQLSKTILAYQAVLLAKERAGLERAMGANGFGKGKFAPNILRRFVDLIGQQRAFINTFASIASDRQQAFLKASLSGPVIDEVERLRDIAANSPFTNDLQGISGPVWFDAITKKIDLLKTVEDRLAAELVSLAEAKEARASAEFWMMTIALGLIIGATCWFGWSTINDIVRALRSTVATITKLARGEQTAISGVERHDEIGALSRSLETVYQKGLEAARLRSALDRCTNMVMVISRHSKVVYINPALHEHFQQFGDDLSRSLTAADLIGEDLCSLGTEFAALKGKIETGTGKQHLDLSLSGRRLKLTISPILNDLGTSLGTVLEWTDVTVELTIQEDMARVISAARRGDFSQAIDLRDIDGVYRNLADGINQLSTTVNDATEDLATVLGAMAEGDLTRRMTTDYEGRFGELKASANHMAEQLGAIVAQVQQATSEVETAAAEISAGTEDLSHRTEQAASNLEETAAASEQMSSTVTQNADNARNADRLASSANQVANRGGQVAEQAVSAMAGIEDSAQKITDIIGVIDEIAFQTNLLALNASVEAARAGEAGKGFAVVAQEVRQLAQRSAQAASDIKRLIQNSNNQVQDGVGLVNQAGKALAEILDSIGQVTSIVQEIASASQEQAVGVQEINNSITSMDEMTQQNSALVEESAATARSLSDQARNLTELLGFFKLDRGSGPHANQIRSAAPASKRPAVSLETC